MDVPTSKQKIVRKGSELHTEQRSNEQALSPASIKLPAPENLTAESGTGQVTLRWQTVPEAVGYLVLRSKSPTGPFTQIDHGGGDVLAVPGPPYVDTTGIPGQRYCYTVTAISDTHSTQSEHASIVKAGSLEYAAKSITLHVKARTVDGLLKPIWQMLGSDHLSQIFYDKDRYGNQIGSDFEEALRLARSELGATHIRAHAILNDEQGVYKEVSGQPRYDFTAIDRIYDHLLQIGLQPIVELSFMPHDLAARPNETVFTGGIISPPRDWQRWGELNQRLAEHLVQRYGIEEVSQWGFEIWNEANLETFWTGTKADYFKLYNIAARAIKAVDTQLRVGGPSTAAAEWISDFLDFVQHEHVPLDFISTHTYGNFPLDIKQALETRGMYGIKTWWTAWGITPTHFAEINDSAFAAPFVLHGMKSAQGRVDALANWAISDHCEELGRPPRLLHGGSGLLTVGNLRKPRYWALALAESLDTQLIKIEIEGDGARSMVDAWASRKPDGTVDLLIWNGTLNQSKFAGDPLLARMVLIQVEQLQARLYEGTMARIDLTHSNIAEYWSSEKAWPTPEEWETLRQADKLDEAPLQANRPIEGRLDFAFYLPMPGVVRIRLIPQVDMG